MSAALTMARAGQGRHVMRQRGMISVVALMLLASVVTLTAIITLRVANTGVNDSLNQSSNVAALFLAESGLEYATQQLSSGAASCGAMPVTTQSVGRGSFTISTTAVTDYDGVTALSAGQCRIQVSGGVTNSDVTRTVQGIINYSGAGSGTIALDNSSSRARNNSRNFTFSHAVAAAGSNRLLVVGIVLNSAGGSSVTSVRYAGTSLSRIGVQNYASAGIRVELWRLVAPAGGSNNVSVRLSRRTSVVAGAVSLTGVDQSSPVEASNFAFNTSKTPAVSVTTLTDNAWVVDVLGAVRNSPSPSAGAGQTLAWSAATTGGGGGRGRGRRRGGGGGAAILGASSTEGPRSPAGSVTMSWSFTGAPRSWVLGAAAIKPSGGGSIGVLSWREIVS